jgi:hypothetical protein
MKYYSLQTEKGALEIIKVKEADEVNFLEDYGMQVVASGSTLSEALKAFEIYFYRFMHDEG